MSETKSNWYGDDGFKAKLQEGIDWRGSTTIEIDGDEIDVTYRQLYDREEAQYREKIDLQPFQKAQKNLDEEERDRLQDLANVDDPTDAEREELENLQSQAGLSDGEMSSITEGESADALIEVAKCGIMPTPDDVDYAWEKPESWKIENYGKAPKQKGEMRKLIKDSMENLLEKSTDRAAILLGLRVYIDTLTN